MKHQCRVYCLTLFALMTTFWQFSASIPNVHAGENYAFLVAVGDYDVKHLKPLAYTRNDILEFKALLLKSGFPKQNIVLLHDDLKQLENRRFLPEAEKIRQEFTLLVSGLEPDDTLIVAMAGHGVQFKDDKDSYFCPADADLDDEKHTRLISFNELYKGLKQCEARKKLLLIDACRNDPQSQLSRSRAKVKLQSITRPQAEPVPEGIVALFSCSAGEQAFEWPDLKHGIFFHHVLEGWKGAADDGDLSLSLDELVAYTRKKTQTFARLKLASIQRPQRLGEFSGTWLLRKLDDPDYEFGLKFYLGSSVPMNRDRAYKLFRKAADRGHTLAKTFLGNCYTDGDGIQKNHSEAARWYENALPALRTLAEEGNPMAQIQFGNMYSNGLGVEENNSEAVKWYRRAAEQNVTMAQNKLGNMYYNGTGIGKSSSEAIKWYRKAAIGNYAVAQSSLGVMLEYGIGIQKNAAEAETWYRKAADQNYAIGQHYLGNMYFTGNGVAKDLYEAARWYRKAAEQNHAVSQKSLGVMYENGWGIEKNYSKAIKWYQKAATQNNAEAQNYLGIMYHNGRGVDKNSSEAINWFRKAASQNFAKAQTNLGDMFRMGWGVEKNNFEASKWYHKAAAQDYAQAQYSLGWMYREGWGVSKNSTEAVRWFRKAAKGSDLDAVKKAKVELKKMGYSR